MNGKTDPAALDPGTLLDDYAIEQRIGGGGFSIVYLARANADRARVVIKEYMPRRLACRDEDGVTVRTSDPQNSESFAYGRRLFFEEASTLATLKHPNVVNVLNFFRANGTVYMVMAYEKGVNLYDYIQRRGGNLSEALLRTVIPELLAGLKVIHDAGLLHLDIKPGNIYLRAGGKPLLLDFGAVHRMLQSRQFQPSQVVTPGFAPIEQLDPNGYVGPWTDLYAVGATMRTCIEGTAPIPASERQDKDTLKPAAVAFKRRYSQRLLSAVDWAMEVDPLLRPQSVDAFLQALPEADELEAPVQENSVLGRLSNLWGRGE